jgi:uncharacterized repeat protein (TIGR03806 family)
MLQNIYYFWSAICKISMKKNYVLFCTLLIAFSIISCEKDNEEEYKPVSPVVLDLTQVPYPKLSDYKFFEGEMKAQNPALGVLPYEPISQLFTDYAHKKRFVWMPEGVKATYNGDGKILNFPTGAVLIKTFYYDNVQPSNTTKIIETRLLIKKENEWIFAEYVWNDEQTEATLQTNGGFVDIAWKDENNVIKSTQYRTPSTGECLTCHKATDSAIPIGPKPQNLNGNLTYANGTKNQLEKWVEMGYLDSNYPTNINTVTDWKDTSKPLELRVRSYIDINCAHCHQAGSHCSYRSMRFAFSESANPQNLGICVTPDEDLGNGLISIVLPRTPIRSVLDYRIKSTDPSTRMPLLGRTLVHEEAAQLITEWINSLTPCE